MFTSSATSRPTLLCQKFLGTRTTNILAPIFRGASSSTTTLILQKVGRENRGMYRCRATNTEGEGDSDVVKLTYSVSIIYFSIFEFKWNLKMAYIPFARV
ncbi:hypothetical protein CEXT_447821 [Caerostris extrusa]|uniref:Ig-like domain-containing protein n=1 Tax=Caerostris extrusa TaxID=172846 RepID=A0AAV4VAP8_CAEEX|nr:hypothetical protein CEXT_447821 [Caerostris extrusa]